MILPQVQDMALYLMACYIVDYCVFSLLVEKESLFGMKGGIVLALALA